MWSGNGEIINKRNKKIYPQLNYISCQQMDLLASSSFFLSHLATPPSFCLRSCSNICLYGSWCCVERARGSFILRIKNHGGNSSAVWVRQFSTIKIGCPVILN